MNLLLRASFLINSASQAAGARGTLLSDFPTKPAHPRLLSENRSGRWRGRRLGSKNERAAQSTTSQPRSGKAARRTLPASRRGCLPRPGCESQTWQRAGLSGREGGVALPPGAGSWGRPWESGIFSGGQFPQAAGGTPGLPGWARGLMRTQMCPKAAGIQAPKLGGVYHQRCSYLHRKVREKRKAEPHAPGGH